MEHKQNERWKDVIGYEGIYQISNCGNVRSLKFGIKPKSISIKDNGYCRITFNKDKKQKDFYVHRLVATAFIENPTNKKEINHINGIKTDNRVENLEWSDRTANNKHAYRILGRISTFTGKSGVLNHKSRSIIALNLLTQERTVFESGNLAAIDLNIAQALVSDVLHGKQKQTHGYTFYYNL